MITIWIVEFICDDNGSSDYHSLNLFSSETDALNDVKELISNWVDDGQDNYKKDSIRNLNTAWNSGNVRELVKAWNDMSSTEIKVSWEDVSSSVYVSSSVDVYTPPDFPFWDEDSDEDSENSDDD